MSDPPEWEICDPTIHGRGYLVVLFVAIVGLLCGTCGVVGTYLILR